MARKCVSATLYPKEGKMEELKQLLNNVKAEVKQSEPGTLTYRSCVNSANNSIVMFEEYEDDSAIAKHREGKAYKIMQGKASELFDKRPEILVMEEF